MASIPKYLQIGNIIRDRIDSGDLEPGAQLPPVKNLALEYGTTKATICKMLESLEREKLISKQQGRGTFVCPKINTTIAIVWDLEVFSEDISNSYLQKLNEIYLNCQKRNWKQKLYLNVNSPESAADFLNDADEGKFKYVIVVSRFVAENYSERLRQKKIRLIGLYNYPGLDYFVTPDGNSATIDSISLLVKKGFKRIGIIKGRGKRDFEDNDLYSSEIAQAYRDNGILFDKGLLQLSALTMREGYNSFLKLYQAKPEAIIITDALLTLGASKAVYENKIDPKSLYVVSHNAPGGKIEVPLPHLALYSFSSKNEIKIVFEMLENFESGKEPPVKQYWIKADFTQL